MSEQPQESKKQNDFMVRVDVLRRQLPKVKLFLQLRNTIVKQRRQSKTITQHGYMCPSLSSNILYKLNDSLELIVKAFCSATPVTKQNFFLKKRQT